MIPKLGRMERVDVRAAWPNEASSFTPWMVTEEGLELLQEALNMDLEVEATEQYVGPFKADVVAKRTDTPDEHWVLIENQLERTDHKHLGQLLTYAAGLKACTIVWVAREFEEKHRAALDWLNEITPDTIAFYGLEVELWRIGTSELAPMFNVVAEPNEWTREVQQAAAGGVSELQQQQLRYWQGLADLMRERGSVLRPMKPQPGPYVVYGMGKLNVTLDVNLRPKRQEILVKIRLEGLLAKPWFDHLAAQSKQIEQELGQRLDWQRQDKKKRSQIFLTRPKSDITDEASWPDQHAWLAGALERMRLVFQERVLTLPGEPPESLGGNELDNYDTDEPTD